MKGYVTIYITNYTNAQLIKGKLESEGIPVFLSYDSAAIIYGFTLNGLGKVEIKVPEEYEGEAKKIIEESEKI